MNLSPHMNIFHVVAKDNRVMDFVFDCSMWIWHMVSWNSVKAFKEATTKLVIQIIQIYKGWEQHEKKYQGDGYMNYSVHNTKGMVPTI